MLTSVTHHSCPIPSDFKGSCRSVDCYDKLNRIGEGTYGIVYRAKEKETGKIYALKRVRMDAEADGLPISSIREINLLRSLCHKNIINVLDVVVGKQLDHIFLVMEYCDYDLAYVMDFLIQNNPNSTFPIPIGLEYLHSVFVIHRDLKLSNLLLSHNGILKIADFGLARKVIALTDAMTPRVVTLWYRSPELLLGTSEYSFAIDIWAAGCIMAEFLLAKPLFPGKTEPMQLSLIFDLLGDPSLAIWPDMASLPLYKNLKLGDSKFSRLREFFTTHSTSTLDLLQRMLTYDPKKRLTSIQAQKHRFFTENPNASSPDHVSQFVAGLKQRQPHDSNPMVKEVRAKRKEMEDEEFVQNHFYQLS